MSRSTYVLRPFLARQWRALALAAVSTVVVTAAELARPFPLKLVIDHLFAEGRADAFDLGGSDLWILVAVAGLVLGIALVDAIASYHMDVGLSRAGERIVHELRVAIYAHLQRLSLRFHERRRTGDLVTRLTGDVNAIGELFASSLGTLVSAVLTLAGMLLVSFLIDPVLALAAFAVTPVLAVVSFRYRGNIRALARRQRGMEADIASLAAEALSSPREVKAFTSERFEHGRLQQASEERRGIGFDASRVEGRFRRLIDLLGAAGTTLVLVVGVVRVAQGALSPGDLVVMASYTRRIYRPLREIAREAGRVSKAMARADRIGEILAADDALEDHGGEIPSRKAKGALEFDGVSFGYEADRPVLRDLSLRIPAGRKYALMGPSGAGKSTIAALLARFYDPTSGRILLDGHETRGCSLSWLRSQIGLVLQDTVLFSGTVAENIAYGVSVSREEIEAAAKAAGAHAFICELPEGYDTRLGPRGVGLSGGQRQRIAIARTLLRDPAVLVLDEPTTGLDADSEAQVLAGLETLMRGRTTVMITHSRALAATADRVVVIEDGRVIRDAASQDGPDARSRTPSPSLPVPGDSALPQLPLLLDSDAMARILERSLGDNGGRLDVRIRYLRYKPGTSLIAHYDVSVGREWHEAVATISAYADLATWASKPQNVALARKVDGRSPAPMPLVYERSIESMIQWLPLDLWLPALAKGPSELIGSLRASGIDAHAEQGDPTLLGYKPRRRAVLGLGDHVLKVYADLHQFARAAAGLEVAAELRSVPTPPFEGAISDLAATVQRHTLGRSLAYGPGANEWAGEVLSRLHSSKPGVLVGLPEVIPMRRLEASASSARLVWALVPGLRPRVEALLERLEAELPPNESIVLSHGDFHAGQLFEQEGQLTVLDFDRVCEAPPAFDLATYAAHLVRGEAGDLDVAAGALEHLSEGYGARPADLSWYLACGILGRSPFPFRYLDERWPEHIEGMVDAAETALAL